MSETSSVLSELDAIHLKARAAYRAKDLTAYMAIFAPTVRYKQPDGKIVGRDDLARDVATQFRIVVEVDSSYVRESLQVDGDRATEVLSQTVSASTRHFLFFKRVWRMNRRGRYTWIRLPDGWRIEEVAVLAESIG